ncbi:ferritin [Clostridium polyendosporum]|uniref:Ferritin n=1 Tax=Clostridium polyendosporum TaxID=69208 RepID=A0A919RYD0_9CLOT|nr:DUF3298 and DUF4163 domain-containing protein [Clostridium polyendosporum]GIM28537.1 ferritin [Clostridium polyendosporum]
MKKRFVPLITLIVIFLTTLMGMSIKDDAKGVTIKSKTLKEKYSYINIDLTIPYIANAGNKIYDGINTKIEGNILNWKKDLTEMAKENELDSQKAGIDVRPFDLVTVYKLGYNKNNFLSLYIDYYQYTGGAHGITTRNTYNLDLNSGKNLILKELFNEGYDFKTIINESIKKQISQSPQEYFNGGKDFKGIKDNQDYYVTDDGIVIVYQLYEIAPYVSGIREFKVPFSELKEGLINFK